MPERLVLVTGAAGGIGGALVPALRCSGWRVRALVHRREVEGADESVAGDLLDAASVAAAVAGADAIVHAAAITHARRAEAYERVNVGGTRTLLEAVTGAGVRRLVHVSTRAIDPEGGAYSRTKAAAEALVAAAPLETVVVRLPEVYGSGGAEGIDGMIARARAGRPILVVGQGAWELRPVPLAAAADALAAALDRAPAGRTYTLAGEPLSMRAAAEACSEAFGGRSRVVGIPVAVVAALATLARVLPLPLVPDQLDRLRAAKPPPTPEAAAELSFDPPGFREGLASLSRRAVSTS